MFKFFAGMENKPLSGSMSLAGLCALLSYVMVDLESPCCSPDLFCVCCMGKVESLLVSQ